MAARLVAPHVIFPTSPQSVEIEKISLDSCGWIDDTVLSQSHFAVAKQTRVAPQGETKMTTEINLADLVADRHLDLDSVFSNADWRSVDGIATYIACCYGANGNEPGECEVVLERAEAYGIEAYRWADRDDSGTNNTGDIMLDRDEAIEAGKEVASESDETPDADDQIADILAAGWFTSSVDADDVRKIIDYCATYNDLGQGHVIIDHDGRREWVTTGYVEHEAVYLSIPHGGQHWSAYAVDLLNGINGINADDE